MKTETFKKKIAGIYTKKGKIPTRQERAINYLKRMVKGEKNYPYSWSRSFNRYKLIGKNHVLSLENICQLTGIKLSYGNSAKGGKESDFYFLEKKEIRKLKEVDFSEL